MRIQIAERLRPYSHIPGTQLILPGSAYALQIFPCLIRFYDLSRSIPTCLGQAELNLVGPLTDFTIQQDLEKGHIKVWGHTAHGFVRYVLTSHQDGTGISLHVEHSPLSGLEIVVNGTLLHVQTKEPIALFTKADPRCVCTFPLTERLSLGNHKAQDWEFVKRRVDLTEILPVWNRLGHLVPVFEMPMKLNGTLSLIQKCQQVIEDKKNEEVVKAFQNLFQAGFTSLLTPQLQDELHQGLIFDKSSPVPDCSPFLLLTQGARLIRSLFIQQHDKVLTILPVLPSEFHCGRFLHVPVQGGIISLEWTKKIIRRLVFQATENQELTFHFRKIKQFRLKHNEIEKGRICLAETSLSFEKNCYYLFDNFT